MTATLGHARLPRNVVFAVFEPLAQGLCLFFLYRAVLQTLAAADLGLWSILTATIAMAQMGDLGVGRALVRYVALGKTTSGADGQSTTTADYVHCGLLITAVLYGGLGIAVWLAAHVVLPGVLLAEKLPQAYRLLPLVLGSFWVNALGQVLLSTLVGAHEAARRSIAIIGSELLQLAVVLTCLGSQGILALLYGQVARNFFLLVAGLVLVAGVVPGLSRPRWPRRAVVREILGLGVKLQATNIVAFFFEPTTKLLLGRFGSLDAVAWFEMASRIVLQMRGLVVSACQVAVPVIAELGVHGGDALRLWYVGFARLVSFGSLAVMGLLALSIPLIGRIWIGGFEPHFELFAFLLVAGWLVNLLSVPAYLLGLGLAQVGWNFRAHVGIAIGNLVLGALFGALFGAAGCVIGWVLSLAAGSLFILERNRRLVDASSVVRGDRTLLLAAAFVLSLTVASLGILDADATLVRLLMLTGTAALVLMSSQAVLVILDPGLRQATARLLPPPAARRVHSLQRIVPTWFRAS